MVSRFPSNNSLITKGALLYSLDGRMCALRGRQPVQIKFRAVFASRCSVQGAAHLAALPSIPARITGKQNSGICIMQTPEFSCHIISQYTAPAGTIISEHFAIALSAQLHYNMIHIHRQGDANVF